MEKQARGDEKSNQGMTKKQALEVLNLKSGSCPKEVRKAYKQMARQCHPDKTGGDSSAFQEVEQAYRLLKGTNK